MAKRNQSTTWSTQYAFVRWILDLAPTLSDFEKDVLADLCGIEAGSHARSFACTAKRLGKETKTIMLAVARCERESNMLRNFQNTRMLRNFQESQEALAKAEEVLLSEKDEEDLLSEEDEEDLLLEENEESD